MSIPLLDLNRQYAAIKEEVNREIQKVLESQYFIMGDPVREFEKEIGDYSQANFSYGCASGSDALLLALMAIDLQPGDHVITSPFTFFATGGAIARLGGIPIFLDIDPETYNLDPEQLRLYLEGNHPVQKHTQPPKEKIKAVIPVHLYGQMADMDPIMELAEEHGLYVIEDAAQAIGAEYKGQKAGSIGDFGCFSFFPSKNLGAYGDAGLITVKDQALAEKTDILRLHGANPKYHHKRVGINSRLDTLQAAVLSVKLRYLEEWSEKRREIALRYNTLFKEAGLTAGELNCTGGCNEMGGSDCSLEDDKIYTPVEREGSPADGGRHIYHQYTIRVKKRDHLKKKLAEHSIGHSIYYPVPLHEQECFKYIGYRPEDCPVSHCASKQLISLPIFPELTEQEQRKVVEVIGDIM